MTHAIPCGIALHLDRIIDSRVLRRCLRIFLRLFAVFVVGTFYAEADDRLIAKVIAGHHRLENAVCDISGRITITRDESLSEVPKRTNLEMYIDGNFIKCGSRIRCEFKAASPRSDSSAGLLTQLVAIDAERAYQLLPNSFESPSGQLTVFESPYAPQVRLLVDVQFLSSLNHLWCVGNIPIADFLQRPDASVTETAVEQMPSAVCVRLDSEGTIAEYILDPSTDYACRYATVKAGEGETAILTSISVGVASLPGIGFVPAEISQTATIGGRGYTSKIELDLEPCNSQALPIKFNAESFRDFGLDYTIYSEGVEKGRVFGLRDDLSIPKRSNSGKLLLALAIVLIVSVIAFTIVRHKRRSKP